MGRITIFTTPSCKHCIRAKNILSKYNVEYKEINLLAYPGKRNDMISASNGSKTVPQVFFNDEHIGGADDVQALHESGELEEKIIIMNEGDIVKLIKELSIEEDFEEELIGETSTDLLTSICEIDNVINIKKEDRVYQNGIYPLDGIMATIKDQLRIKSRRFKLRKIKNCFKGSDLIRILQSRNVPKSSLKSFESCLIIARQLYDENYFYRVGSQKFVFDSKGLYRFWEDKDKRVLNMKRLYFDCVKTPSEVSTEIFTKLLTIQEKYFSNNGHSVDYARLGKSLEFVKYVNLTLQLQRLDLSNLSGNIIKSFFINIYNALVIHANCVRGAPKNALQRSTFFNKVGYVIGGEKFTLNVIEHGILRANKKPPGSLFKLFKKTDPRYTFCVPSEEFDPRIHFALVCGAKSCPPIRVFDAEILDEALQLATEGFVTEETFFYPEKKKIKTSMLFNWYHNDFGKTDAEVIDWIASYSCNKKFVEFVKDVGSSNIKLSYSKYNWDQNNRGYEEHNGALITEDDTVITHNSGDLSAYSSDVFTTGSSSFDNNITEYTDTMTFDSDDEDDETIDHFENFKPKNKKNRIVAKSYKSPSKPRLKSNKRKQNCSSSSSYAPPSNPPPPSPRKRNSSSNINSKLKTGNSEHYSRVSVAIKSQSNLKMGSRSNNNNNNNNNN